MDWANLMNTNTNNIRLKNNPNRNTNIIRFLKIIIIRIWILFGLKKSPEYEYYSVWKNHPNTNTNIIRFENNDRIRIRIIWYSNIIRIIFEYRIIRSPLILSCSNFIFTLGHPLLGQNKQNVSFLTLSMSPMKKMTSK